MRNYNGRLKNVWKSLCYIFLKSKKYFLFKLINSIFFGITPVVTALLTKEIINCVMSPIEKENHLAFIYIAIIFIITIFSASLNYIKKIHEPILNSNIELQLNKDLIYKTSRVPLSFFDDSTSYDEMEAASREISSFTSIVDSIFNIISSSISLFMLFPIICELNYVLVLLIIIIHIPVGVIQFSMKSDNFIWTNEIRKTSRCVNGTKHMLISRYYAEEVRVFSLFNWLFNKFTNYYNELNKIRFTKNSIVGRKTFICDSLLALLSVILNSVLILMTISKRILVSDFAVFGTYTSRLTSSISEVINCLTLLKEKELFLTNLFSFLETTNEIKYINSGKATTINKASIEFRNVSFSYPKTGKRVLKNVSFSIDFGEMLAIVGLNGAGKSTIIKLLLRFYEPSSGEILLNNVNINEYSLDEYYKLISIVFQNPMTYPFSLRENILFDGHEPNDNLSGYKWIQKIVENCPNGLDTILLPHLDPTGIDISIGEAQRVAFARAISKKEYKILILDEPTSSMDAEIEYELFKDMRNICHNKTSIIISHRLSSVVIADKIIVLSDNHIVEEGTHEQLMKNNGKYSDLFKMQAEKYIAEAGG